MREPISSLVQTTVLLKSRRRCCICYGLNRDTSLKVGQIAHLDRNSTNAAEDNLAFLCFEHHDQFDSTTRQSKNLTMHEVRAFREELYEAIQGAFATQGLFGNVKAQAERTLEGHYIKVSAGESADIRLAPMPTGQDRYHVSGLALWGTEREYGPNIGELDFIAELEGDTLEFSCPNGDETYRVVLRLGEGKLYISEENSHGMHGMNVTFEGVYERAPQKQRVPGSIPGGVIKLLQ